MSEETAIWIDDQTVTLCTKCRSEFSYTLTKHHCRKCGQIFCEACSKNKAIIPKEQLVIRPTNWFYKNITSTLVSDEDNFRLPQKVCDSCYSGLFDQQSDLRQAVSRAYQDTPITKKTSIPSLPSIDFYLEKEIKKASRMLYCFKDTLGEENIPRELLHVAKGVVFLTVFKAGFMITGRFGTGLVIAKLGNGEWSAPSAVLLTGLGWGIQVGAELTDVILILSTDQAVKTFQSRAQVSIGSELGVSVGPVGRSIESDVTAGEKGAAHAFSYARSKGLFLGASLEAAAIASRPDVNRAFYGETVSAATLLSGAYPQPKGAEPLYQALNEVLKRGHGGSRPSVRDEVDGAEGEVVKSSRPRPVDSLQVDRESLERKSRSKSKRASNASKRILEEDEEML